MKFGGYHPEAEEELDDALVRSHDPLAFQNRVDNSIRDILSGVVVHARFKGTPARQCLLQPLPYSMIYVDDPTEIRIIALAHHKRRPGYWKRRLKST